MSDAAIQQPSPTKRGRGRGRGGSTRGAASARARGKPAAGRRGRAKVYENSRVQAAHERQRDIKNNFNILAAALKPALETLADRNLQLLSDNHDAHKEVAQYQEIQDFLQDRLEDRQRVDKAILDTQIDVASKSHEASMHIARQNFTMQAEDRVEKFYDTQLLRLDVLKHLADNGLPVDTEDQSYNFKSITTAQAADLGVYSTYHNGVKVPFPQAHEHFKAAAEAAKKEEEEARKAKADAAAAAALAKRKPADQADDASTPRRPRSALENIDPQVASAMPRHIGGLLSAVVPEETVSQPASPSSAAENEPVAAPRPAKPKSKSLLNGIRDATTPGDDSEAEEDHTMPPVPNHASEPDEQGVRLINKRARGNDAPNNRIMVPNLYDYEPHEIGFRDSTNDKTRSATKAKRRGLLNKPDSNAMFFDRIVAGYDCTKYAEGDLDKDTIKEFNLHPKYGLFLNTSVNEDVEKPRPIEDGQRPSVFVSDAGQVIHTSRSVQPLKAEQPFRKMQFGSALAIFMDQEGIDEQDLYDEETERLTKERDAKRAKAAAEQEEREHHARVREAKQVAETNIQSLLDAAAQLEASASAQPEPVAKRTRGRNQQESQSLSPVVSRPSTMSRPYDAVRDSFGGSDLPPASTTASQPAESNIEDTRLKLLSDMAMLLVRSAEAEPAQAPVAIEAQSNVLAPPPARQPTPAPEMEVDPQIPIQMPEPVRPKQLRDPSELEQNDAVAMDYPDPENEFVPRQLIPSFPTQYPAARDPVYMVQQPQPFQEQRLGSQGQLAQPEGFAYREPGVSYEEQQARSQLQPLQQPYPDQQQGLQPPHMVNPDQYPYENPEASYEQQPQLAQPVEETHAPAPLRPNVEDVALLDPQLFAGTQQPAPTQLQAPQPEQVKPQPEKPSGVLQQPHTSFFQTALNSPDTPTAPNHPQALESYEQRPQAYHQQSAPPPMTSASRPAQVTGGDSGRLPFSNPIGTEAQHLPALRPMHRASGPLMAPTSMTAHGPQHMMLTPTGPPSHQDIYPQPPPQGYYYPESAYSVNGYGPDQPILSTEQDPRIGYMAQPMMHPSQLPPQGYPMQPSYHPQVPSQYGQPPQQGPPGQFVQSPPPFGHGSRTVSPSPGRRSSGSRNTKQTQQQQQSQQPGYREIKPAPRHADTWEVNGGELRTLLYNPFEGIRDYNATAPPPSHGPTQIRGWTHNTQANRKSRGKNSSADAHVDPALSRDEKK